MTTNDMPERIDDQRRRMFGAATTNASRFISYRENHSGVTVMDITRTIQNHGAAYSGDTTSIDPASVHSPLAVATGFLDAALRMWDDDRIQARSRVKVAAAMLRGYSNESMADVTQVATTSTMRGLAPWQTRKVKEFIDASLNATIRLNDCASRARLSASYFSHAFKTTFGTTVSQYIRRRRVERAQRLMLLSAEPLAQIAISCGFADQAHYCRVFRDVVGLSPNAWRRRNMYVPPEE